MLGRRNPPDSTYDFLSDPTQLPSEFKGWLRNWLLNQPATTTGTATALPTGNAGGDLTGSTYPSPVLKASGVTAATYGDSTHVAQVAVNAKGLVTAASNVALAASGYATVQDEGTPLTQRSTMNFVGSGVTASDSGSLTTVTIPGGAGGGNYTLITDTLLGADTASFAFSSISGYKHLKIVVSLRTDRAATEDLLLVQFNADTTAGNYFTQRELTSATSVSASEFLGSFAGYSAVTTGATAAASLWATAELSISDYLGTTAKKTCFSTGIAPSGVTTGLLDSFRFGMLWNNTAAITGIVLKPGVGTVFKSGSRATLYGLN